MLVLVIVTIECEMGAWKAHRTNTEDHRDPI